VLAAMVYGDVLTALSLVGFVTVISGSLLANRKVTA